MRARGLMIAATAVVAAVATARALVSGPAWVGIGADPSPDTPPGQERMMPGGEDMVKHA